CIPPAAPSPPHRYVAYIKTVNAAGGITITPSQPMIMDITPPLMTLIGNLNPRLEDGWLAGVAAADAAANAAALARPPWAAALAGDGMVPAWVSSHCSQPPTVAAPGATGESTAWESALSPALTAQAITGWYEGQTSVYFAIGLDVPFLPLRARFDVVDPER